MPRIKIDTEALRNLALTVSISQIAQELGISRPSVYAYLDGRLPVNLAHAQRINAKLRRFRQRSQLCEVVAAGLNARANNRLSVRSKTRGPFTKYEILRYNLGPLDQRYDASDHTLLVNRIALHHVLAKSSLVHSMPTARDELIHRGLITLRNNPLPNLALGCALPHRPVVAYAIDLQRIEWSTLRALVETSATRSDPCDTGIVYTRRYPTRNTGLQDMRNGCNPISLPVVDS